MQTVLQRNFKSLKPIVMSQTVPDTSDYVKVKTNYFCKIWCDYALLFIKLSEF